MSVLQLLVENGVGNTIRNAQATWDYLRGKRHDTLELKPATVDDIKSSNEVSKIVDMCKKSKADCSVEVDRYSGKLRVTLDAKAVPSELSSRLVPGGDLYDQLLYDNGSIYLDFDAPNLPDAPNETGNFTIPHNEEESVMTPTPTPYKCISAKKSVLDLDIPDETVTEGNSFKSHHVCQGCGNTLDKCTCKVDEEELDEDFSGSATQVSNVGQHKSSCLDLIEKDDNDEVVKMED